MVGSPQFEAERTQPVWEPSLRPRSGSSLGRHDMYDVVIIGAGFTGLWTAHHLIERDPSLSIAVLDSHYPGFGASGRNGGWCSALFAAELPDLAELHGRESAVAMQRAMFETVDEIATTISRLGIDCGWVKGGTLTAATGSSHHVRLHHLLETYRRFGFDDEDFVLLNRDETTRRINIEGAQAAMFTPHCAAINPQQLIDGLVNSLASRGVRIFEGARVTSYTTRRLSGCDAMGDFTVEANWIVRATEAYTCDIRQHHRDVIPIYSYMVATEPLGSEVWRDIGWDGRETFSDLRHMIIYAQRTSDDRIAFGGRGIGYRYSSRIKPSFECDDNVHRRIVKTMHQLFPATRDVTVTHRWGGPLAVPRDWHPAVVCDVERRVAHAGGYVGDGVASSHLAGRTIAEIITRQESAVCSLPWVQHVSPRWEREPLRWMGMNAVSRLVRLADTIEAVTHRPARRTQSLIDRVTG